MKALQELKAAALAALAVATSAPIDDDDRGMFDTSDDDLLAWCNDLEWRCDVNVTEFRAALHEYIEARAHGQLLAAGHVCDDTPPDFVIVDGAEWDCFTNARDALVAP